MPCILFLEPLRGAPASVTGDKSRYCTMYTVHRAMSKSLSTTSVNVNAETVEDKCINVGPKNLKKKKNACLRCALLFWHEAHCDITMRVTEIEIHLFKKYMFKPTLCFDPPKTGAKTTQMGSELGSRVEISGTQTSQRRPLRPKKGPKRRRIRACG